MNYPRMYFGLKTAYQVFLSSRVFPYGRYLVTLFPFYSFLIADGSIYAVWQLSYVLPFVFAMSAGFIFNTLCDAPTDPQAKNPIARGTLTRRQASFSVSGMSLLCIAASIVVYSSWTTIVAMALYLLVWLSYSGLKVRLKESILAPAVASYVLWAGPPLILLIQFSYFGMSPLLLLLAIFFIYIGHEIKHTIIEHDMDLQYGSRTFSIIIGRRNAAYAEYVALAAGFIVLVAVGYLLLWEDEPGFLMLFSILFVSAVMTTVIKGIRSSFKTQKDSIYVTIPYISTKAFLVFLGAMTIGLSPLVVLFVVWIFLIEPYP